MTAPKKFHAAIRRPIFRYDIIASRRIIQLRTTSMSVSAARCVISGTQFAARMFRRRMSEFVFDVTAHVRSGQSRVEAYAV